jgi:hypothetical protein
MPPILVQISAGELIDKITILGIKSARMTDATKRRNVRRELAALLEVLDRAIAMTDELDALGRALLAVNEELWEIEDAIRDREARGDFGPSFVALARSVYRTNDRRAAIKRRIDEATGSALTEAKEYRPYP